LNVLAHAVLSPRDERVRLGNVLADFIHRNEVELLDDAMKVGVTLHKRIDQFTDSHQVVDRSKARLVGFQRYGNALVDVFYDHFLTRHWSHELSVRDFTNELYQSIQAHNHILPETCVLIANRMIAQDWMNHYGTFEDLATNLGRMELRIQSRTGRSVDLVSSIKTFEKDYESFEADFLEFWPELVGHKS
jgi:acyl carrier protein phosphodiesterase